MSVIKKFSLGPASITDHCFSDDRSLLAIARGNVVELYFAVGPGKYEHGDTLRGHDKTITALDVNKYNQIVTCSEDRNAIVWTAQEDGSWKQTMALLKINRGATCVRWSPSGLKFAVGSAARVISVCHYDEENDWWIYRHIKEPLKSTILAVAWHPNSVLLGAATTDGHARVFSAFIKGVDEKPAPSVWGERLPFKTLCADFTDDSAAWAHDICFSPSGNVLAWVTHDSSLLIAYPTGPETAPEAVHSVSTSFLPLRSLNFIGENDIVAAGHDCHPIHFKGDVSGWRFDKSIDDKKSENPQQQEQSALRMFRDLDLKGTQESGTTLPTTHQNAITTLRKFDDQSFTTSGDGLVVVFSL